MLLDHWLISTSDWLEEWRFCWRFSIGKPLEIQRLWIPRKVTKLHDAICIEPNKKSSEFDGVILLRCCIQYNTLYGLPILRTAKSCWIGWNLPNQLNRFVINGRTIVVFSTTVAFKRVVAFRMLCITRMLVIDKSHSCFGSDRWIIQLESFKGHTTSKLEDPKLEISFMAIRRPLEPDHAHSHWN